MLCTTELLQLATSLVTNKQHFTQQNCQMNLVSFIWELMGLMGCSQLSIGGSYFDQFSSIPLFFLDLLCLLRFCRVCPEKFPTKGLKIFSITVRSIMLASFLFTIMEINTHFPLAYISSTFWSTNKICVGVILGFCRILILIMWQSIINIWSNSSWCTIGDICTSLKNIIIDDVIASFEESTNQNSGRINA